MFNLSIIENFRRNNNFQNFRFLVIAFIFTIFLFIFDLIVFPLNEVSNTLQSVINGNSLISLSVYFGLTLIAFLLTVYAFYLAFTSGLVWKIIWFILFSLAVLTQYSFYDSLHRFLQIEDYELIFTIRQMFTFFAIRSNFNYLHLIFCLIFAGFLIFIQPKIKSGWRQNATVLVLSCVFFAISSYFTSNLYPTTAFTSFYRTTINFPVDWFLGSKNQSPRREIYTSVREKLNYKSTSQPTNNIVFIVDESVRADHLSLNGYPRDTTPFLIELEKKGWLKNWGTAVSGGTCSNISNNLLLTGLADLPDPTYKIYKMPTIFQYAAAMGYKTYQIDGIFSKLWFGKKADFDFLDARITDENWKTENLYETDAVIARKIQEINSNSTGNFIWVNKLGIHVPYRKAYPPTAQTWQPVSEDISSAEITDEIKAGLKNNYDNALKFNSHTFFTNLLKDGVPANTYFIYTSDHGQTLSANGERFSHCSDTRNEAVVPLVIIARPELLNEVDTSFPAAHKNIFGTLLEMMNFPKEQIKYNYPPSLFEAKSNNNNAPRTYFIGDVTGRRYYRSIPFDK